MTGRFAIIGAVGLLTGCAALLQRPAPPPDEPEITETRATEVAPEAEERAAPEEPEAAPGVLGRTVASLGDPTQGGAWLVTGLVTQATPGRVTDLASGARTRVELRPSGAAPGAGSRLSLAGFQALGLPLTALPDLEVTRE